MTEPAFKVGDPVRITSHDSSFCGRTGIIAKHKPNQLGRHDWCVTSDGTFDETFLWGAWCRADQIELIGSSGADPAGQSDQNQSETDDPLPCPFCGAKPHRGKFVWCGTRGCPIEQVRCEATRWNLRASPERSAIYHGKNLIGTFPATHIRYALEPIPKESK